MYTLFVLLLWIVAIFALIRRYYAIAIFDFMWGIFLTISGKDIASSDFSKTLSIIFLMILFVNVGYFCSSKFTLKTNAIRTNKYTEYNEKFVHFILLISFLILSYYAVQTIRKFGLNLQLVRSSNNSDSEEKVFSSFVDTIAYYGVAIPIIYVSFLSSAYNVSQGIRQKKITYLLMAINVILYIIVSGGRTMIIRIVLFYAAAILWKLHTHKTRIKKRNIIVGAVFVYLVLNIVTAARNNSNISFLEQSITYMKGSLVHMDYQLANLSDRTNYLGYVTYGGFFYYPVKLLKAVFQIPLLTSNEIMEYLQAYTYLQVGNNVVYYNALVPNAYYYYFDLGYVGVVLFSLILGYCAYRSESSFKKPSFPVFVLWAVSLYAIAYSAFGGVMWSYTIPTAIIYSLLLWKIIYKSKR